MNAYAHVIKQMEHLDLDLRSGWLQPHARFYGFPFLAGVLLLAAAWYQPWVPVTQLLRDPLSAAAISQSCCHLHDGAVSDLGVLIWTGAAAVCLFAGLLLLCLVGRSPETRFMLYGGLLTGLLAVDNLFLLHDHMPTRFAVPQLGILAAFGAAVLTYLVCFRRQILEHDAAILVAAVALLATSVGIDQVLHGKTPVRIFAEDGAKLLGIILWAAFHIRTALTLCYRTPRFAQLGVAADLRVRRPGAALRTGGRRRRASEPQPQPAHDKPSASAA